MWSIFGGLEASRRKLHNQTSPGVLRYFYEQPFPDNKTLLTNIRFVVMDFETTGLDIHTDHIISYGLVEIEKLGIRLSTSRQQIIHTSRSIRQENAVIHHITDDVISGGEHIKFVLDELLNLLRGKVLIAHNAKLELGFLNQLCLQFYQQKFVIPCIDTMQLAKRQLLREQVELEQDMLRLFSLRDRLNLPKYKAHNALADALTTAELFLVLNSALYPDMNARLGDLILKK